MGICNWFWARPIRIAPDPKIWYKSSYIFYICVLILLFAVDFFGVTSSGSKRWINLFVFNLQPSELMKITIILFLARYYNKIPYSSVSQIKFIFIPLFVLFVPVALVIKQPDLGTSLMIAMGGLTVIWLAGIRVKYFMFSFVTFLCMMPVAISLLKPYQKLRILTFLK